MIKPEPHIIKSLAKAVSQYPELLEWLEDMRAHEMKRLPYVIENVSVFQGRAQMISEVIGFLKETPNVAAKL